MLETLSGGPSLPIYDVRWTPTLSGCYKLNVEAGDPVEGSKWGICVVVRDVDGVVIAANWQVAAMPFYYQIQR